MDNSIKHVRENLIEDKINQKILECKNRKQTIKSNLSDLRVENHSINIDNQQPKNLKNQMLKDENFENINSKLNNKNEINKEKLEVRSDDQINLLSTEIENNNSIGFNDKFSFADKVTFESEKLKNDELFNIYTKSDLENESNNNESIRFYTKKLIKNNNSFRKNENSSITSEKQINDSILSDNTLQSSQFPDMSKNGSICKTDENVNHYLQIIEYKLQMHNKQNKQDKKSNFNTNSFELEKTRNEIQNNVASMSLYKCNKQNSSSINSSLLNSTINTQKKESENLQKNKSPTFINNTINTSSSIPRKINPNNNSSINNRVKLTSKILESKLNDLNNIIKKKEDQKHKEINCNNQKKILKSINHTSINTTNDELDNSYSKKSSLPCKNVKNSSNEGKLAKKITVSIDKTYNNNSYKHVKTSSVCSVKNLKNKELELKYEPITQQRSSSNTNTSNKNSENNTNIDKIKIDNININIKEEK